MVLERYGFILKAAGYEPAMHNAQIDCAGFASRIVCVSDVDQAVAAAQHMIEAGVQLIELCGGFSVDEAAQLIAAVNGAVPVGHVAFSPRELQRLQDFLAG